MEELREMESNGVGETQRTNHKKNYYVDLESLYTVFHALLYILIL